MMPFNSHGVISVVTTGLRREAGCVSSTFAGRRLENSCELFTVIFNLITIVQLYGVTCHPSGLGHCVMHSERPSLWRRKR